MKNGNRPIMPNLRNNLDEATSKSKLGDYIGAHEICKTMLSEFPESYEIFETRSEIFYRMGDYENAFSDLEQVIELMPNEPAPLFRRGRWKLKLGNYKDAIRDLSQVIESGTDYFIDSAYFFRAQAYLYCHEYKKVLSDCDHIPDGFFIGPNFISKEELISQANKALNSSR